MVSAMIPKHSQRFGISREPFSQLISHSGGIAPQTFGSDWTLKIKT
jgi:hypothetical protein